MVTKKFPNDLDKSDFEREEVPPNEMSKGAEQEDNSMGKQYEEDKIANSLVDDDGSKLDDATLINDALNQGMGGFSPNMMFEKLVQNYKSAVNIYGESLVRSVTGENLDYLEKQIKYPEFKRELEKRMKEKQEDFKKKKLMDKKSTFTNEAIKLASLTLYTAELDEMETQNDYHGEKFSQKPDRYGEKQDTIPYKKGCKFRDIAIKKSIRTLISRGKKKLDLEDMKVFERMSKGSLNLIYAIDCSSSMKGKKLDASKRAGIALAYKAITGKDNVGCIVFADKIIDSVEPTNDFVRVARPLSLAKPEDETNFVNVIEESIKLFPQGDELKHLVILTDALPTSGDDPVNSTLQATSIAKASNITISIIGINLDHEGENLAKQITSISEGRLYKVAETDNLNQVVLQDYYAA